MDFRAVDRNLRSGLGLNRYGYVGARLGRNASDLGLCFDGVWLRIGRSRRISFGGSHVCDSGCENLSVDGRRRIESVCGCVV